MGLKAALEDAMKAAMKGRDELALSALRLLLSALHNEEIKVRRDLTEEEILKVISSLCRQREESIDFFQKGRRTDLAEREKKELEVLRRFLPEPLSEEEVQNLIRSAMEEVGARGIQDLGRVMKHVMPKFAGRADGRRASELAKAMLGGGG